MRLFHLHLKINDLSQTLIHQRVEADSQAER